MSINEEQSSSVQAIAPESVDANVALPVPNHIANISEPSESIELDDASITDLLSRPENFVLDADFMESLYHSDRFHEHNSFSNSVLDPSHQQGAADQHEASQHPQSESLPGQYSVDQTSWTQTSEIQHPRYHVGQTSINQNTTTQTLNPQFAPGFVPSNNGLYQGVSAHTSAPLSFDGQSGDNDQLLAGPSVPSQNAFEHPHNISNVSHYSLAHVVHHQNELASFHQQQPDGSEGMGPLNNGQSAFPQQQMSIPYQNQDWNNVPAFPPAGPDHNNAPSSDGSDRDSADPPAAPVAQVPQQGEGTCGKSGRKPAGRKGRPKPTTYSEMEEAVIIEGMFEGVSFADIGEELGRLGQAIEHKLRRMKARGKL